MKPAAWQPLLEGELRTRALETIRDIAEALRNPPPSPTPGLKEEESAVFDLGLFTGRAGIALFFAYLSETDLLPDAEDLAWAFLEEAENGLTTREMSHSLCEGFSGIAWTHAHLHQSMAREPDRGALKEIDETILDLLGHWPWADQYELLYGLVGIGVYALERLPRPRARAMLRVVVDRLSESAERRADGSITWREPASSPQHRRGEYNLGVAHGVPGVIGFLARAASAPGGGPKARNLLRGVLRWLETQRLPVNLGGGFPAFTTPGETPMACRVAWCYGDPGVATAQFSAGLALDQPELVHQAVKLALDVAERPEEETLVVDAGLCHGATGLGHLYNRLHQATGDRRLGTVATRWFARAFELRRTGVGVAGFTPVWPETDDGVVPTPADPGFLTGAAGIGLALLAAVTPVRPAWDRLLLLEDLPSNGGARGAESVAGLAAERG